MDDNNFGIPEFETIFELILACLFILAGFSAIVFMQRFLGKKIEVNSYVDKIKVTSVDVDKLDPFNFNGYESLMMSVIMDKYSPEPLSYQMVKDIPGERHTCWYDDATGCIGTGSNELPCIHMTGISPAGSETIKFEDYQIQAVQGGNGINSGQVTIGANQYTTYLEHLPIRTAVQFMASTPNTSAGNLKLCENVSDMINFYRDGKIKLCLRDISPDSASSKEMKKWRWVLVPQ